jgi:hypothetical protein
LPEDDQDRGVLIFKEDGYAIQRTPLYPAEHNLKKQYLKIKINDDETIIAEKSIFTYGVYEQAQRFWMLYTPPELIQEALKETIQVASIGATLDNYKIENLDDLNKPVVLNYSFRGPEYLIIAGKMRIMPQLASLDTTMVAKDKRKYPIDFSVLGADETILDFEIPEHFTVRYIPSSISEDNPWFKFTLEYKQKNNKIHFRQKIESKRNVISEVEYPDFKVILESLAKKIKQRVILQRD